MADNYEKILERISSLSNLEVREIERRVEAKRAKLSGLISREGAAQVVASELGIMFDQAKLKIDELLPGMRKVNVSGKIINIFPVRTFTTKKGDVGKVVSLILADDTSNVKVVLWDTNHISHIENLKIKKDSVVEIVNGSMRDNEVHLGSFSEFKLSNEVFEDIVTERTVQEKTITNFRVGDSAVARAFVVQTFEPRFFYVCSLCKKKVVSGDGGFICADHNVVTPEKRALINLVIDDGTENIRAVVFHEGLKNLGVDNLDNPEDIIARRRELLGKELLFKGNVKLNKFFNNSELVIDEVNEVNLDEIIARLEK
jgi:hypothetical protein